jgi:two-component system, LytTR family, sensor kinase
LSGEAVSSRALTVRRILIAWAIYGCVASLQQDLSSSIRGMSISLWMGFALQLPQTALWAAFTPLILWLGRRFPLRGSGWPKRLLLHVGFSAVLVFAVHLTFELYLPWFPWPQSGTLITRTLDVFGLWAIADSMLYWVVLAIGHVQQVTEENRARQRRQVVLEEQLARARLDALTHRLQPHFLFNTLHAISSLVLEHPAAANEMLVRLSDLLRLTLSCTETPFVPLDQELELLEHYLALQEMRFGDRLVIELAVASGTPSALVPALLLQPLVENAVRHAIAGGARPARVRIGIGAAGVRLCCTVEDNGPGFRDGFEEGEGLRNTRARLAEAYGDRQELLLGAGRDGGASVTITIPVEPPEAVSGETAVDADLPAAGVVHATA